MHLDFRSDTVTKPTPEMYKSISEAVVGDDVFGEDSAINNLEKTGAEMLGKEAAMFVTSGTMGNLLAILTHCQRGQEVILGRQSHIFVNEVGGASCLGGVSYNTIPEDSLGKLSPQDIIDAIRDDDIHYPKTGLICLENTHNLAGGTVLTTGELKIIADIAHARSIPVHLDGSRLFNAATFLGLPVASLAAEMDSVQICLSKGLGGPVGSLLAGKRSFVDAARRFRKMLGGGMRQAGILAAPGLIALTVMSKRLEQDHEHCRVLSQGLHNIPNLSVDMASVQTNMVYVDTSQVGWTSNQFVEQLKQHGLLITATHPHKVRYVTHFDLSLSDVYRAIDITKHVVMSRGKLPS